jgi:hypothetical protein
VERGEKRRRFGPLRETSPPSFHPKWSQVPELDLADLSAEDVTAVARLKRN